jgi:hypothetical protein
MRLKNAGMHGVYELFTRRNLVALSMIYHEIQKIADDTVKDLMLLAFIRFLSRNQTSGQVAPRKWLPLPRRAPKGL